MQKVTDSRKLQSTLDDLRRRLKQERQEAETMTHNLSAQREHGRLAEDTRVRRLESELSAAQQQLSEQREENARLAQQMAADRREAQLRNARFEEELAALEAHLAEQRDAAETLAKGMRLSAEGGAAEDGVPTLADFSELQSEAASARKRIEELVAERDAVAQRLKDAESWGRALEEEESRLRAQMETQRESMQGLINDLQAERDEARTSLTEVEGRTRAVEEEFIAAQEKSREQREAAREVIQQMESEREEQRTRIAELESRTQWLEEELAAARRQLQEAGLPVSESGMSGIDQKDLYWRLTVPLTLAMVSTDLLAMNSQTPPQMREAVKAIQQESRRMLESLRQRGAIAPLPEATVPGTGSKDAPEAEAA